MGVVTYEFPWNDFIKPTDIINGHSLPNFGMDRNLT